MYCVQHWGTQNKKDVFEQVQRKDTNMTKVLKHLFHEKRLRELSLLSFVKKRLQGELTAALQYLKGDYKQERD